MVGGGWSSVEEEDCCSRRGLILLYSRDSFRAEQLCLEEECLGGKNNNLFVSLTVYLLRRLFRLSNSIVAKNVGRMKSHGSTM